MNIFSKVNELSNDQLHPKFKNLLRPEFKCYRDIIQNWVDGFIDRDNKIIKEFQTTYHSSFWEFYLFALFKELGFTLDQAQNRPDFIITKPFEMYIEAVVPNIKKGGIPESNRNLNDIMSMFIPPYEQADFYDNLNEAIVRQSNSILKKNNLYKNNYSKCSWVNTNKPYIIALSSYDQVNYGREYIYPMMALLYGKYYIPDKESYEDRFSIKKPSSNSDIPIGIFNNHDYENISAIIYTSTLSVGKLSALSISKGNFSQNEVYSLYRNYQDTPSYKLKIVSPESPELLSDGIFIFHNPNAKNKLPLQYFENSGITQFSIKDNGTIYHTNLQHLIVRTDFPKLLKKGFNTLILEYVRHYNKVGMNEFYDIKTKNEDYIDFTNDCCVYLIGTNLDPKLGTPFLRCKYKKPCVMPDSMLKNEAIRISNKLIAEKRMGKLLEILILRNTNDYQKFKFYLYYKYNVLL